MSSTVGVTVNCAFQKLLGKTLMSAELRACEETWRGNAGDPELPNFDPDLAFLQRGSGYRASFHGQKLDTLTV